MQDRTTRGRDKEEDDEVSWSNGMTELDLAGGVFGRSSGRIPSLPVTGMSGTSLEILRPRKSPTNSSAEIFLVFFFSESRRKSSKLTARKKE
jgi:hypothetical protein